MIRALFSHYYQSPSDTVVSKLTDVTEPDVLAKQQASLASSSEIQQSACKLSNHQQTSVSIEVFRRHSNKAQTAVLRSVSEIMSSMAVPTKRWNVFAHATALIGLFCALVLTPACQPQLSLLEQVQQRGVLKVVTRPGPTTYQVDGENVSGFEYELVSLFAQELGVALDIEPSQSIDDMMSRVKNGDRNLAAAGLAITHNRSKSVSFSHAYQQVTQKLIYRTGTRKPRSLTDLLGKSIIVASNSSHEERLKVLKLKHPELTWHSTKNLKAEQLMRKVYDREYDLTIVDSTEFDSHRALMPELRAAFDLGQPDNIAWAFDLSTTDPSLLQAADQFIKRVKSDGTVDGLLHRYFGHLSHFDYVNARTFLHHMESRLPKYIDDFQLAAIDNDVDWRLVAAISYQESHWDPKAVSPTGVRGIMMLTLDTAKEMKVSNRINAKQSIDGGTAYFRKIYNRWPIELQEPHRLWFTLASYNMGYGHVTDARRITKLEGDDPNNWFDVKKRLPLLQHKDYYPFTRYGYARGARQALVYVENIRKYYEVLTMITDIHEPLYAELPAESAVGLGI